MINNQLQNLKNKRKGTNDTHRPRNTTTNFKIERIKEKEQIIHTGLMIQQPTSNLKKK